MVEGKYAGSTYESTVSELESAVESAQDTLDTLKEEQTALLALEDGVVTADEDGTIAAVLMRQKIRCSQVLRLRCIVIHRRS